MTPDPKAHHPLCPALVETKPRTIKRMVGRRLYEDTINLPAECQCTLINKVVAFTMAHSHV